MKKIIIKKKIVEVTEAVKVQFIPAIEMEEGIEYMNTSCTAILTLNKVGENTNPAFKGIRSLMCIPVEVNAMHMNGGERYTCSLTGLHPILVAPEEEIQRIKNAAAQYNSRVAAHKPQSAAPVKTKVIINAEGKKEVVKVEKVSRGNIDPRTGYGTGTQGHMVGTIMLDNKCSPSTRAICVAKIHEVLVKDYGFEDRKGKALAQSWYSTLWTKKAQIYQKKW